MAVPNRSIVSVSKRGKDVAENKDFQTLVAQAEKAVAAVKDPELKRIAFQKVLESLLSGDAAEAPEPSARRRSKKVKEPPTKRSRKRAGTASYISELIEENFFKQPKTIAQVKAELENRGHHIPMTSLSGPLQKKCQQRELRRQKVKAAGKKETFAYSIW